jgi:ABC-2 type transport system ATP-binding protein
LTFEIFFIKDDLMTILIEATHLRKTFGRIVAVDDLSLHLEEGEIYGLVGSDGAGKTTTIRLLVAALRPDSGHASVCGYPLDKKAEQARAQLGYLSQRFSLYEDLTVLENIRFFAELRGLSRREWLPRCLETLEFIGLADFKDRRAGQLSGGMKQKLGLASALVTRPRVLLLDEPTTGVDPVTRQDFWQLIIRLVSAQQNKVCVLISTPYMDEAARCHRIGFMQHGKLVMEGTPGELRSTLNDRILELRGEPLLLVRRLAAMDPGVEDVHSFSDRLHLRLVDPQAEAVIDRLRASLPQGGAKFIDARVVPPILEDVFIHLSKREA